MLSLENYNDFLKSKLSPFYTVKNRKIIIKNITFDINKLHNNIKLSNYLFDYQKFIINLALQKQRFAVYSDCGTGKTAIFLEWIKQLKNIIQDKKILIVSPLAVIKQTIEEENKFYGKYTIKNLYKKNITEWLNSKDNQIGIINYDKFHNSIDFNNKIGAVVLDESSILKNGMGVIRNSLVESFRGVPFKLCCTATPAPNDRQEYANHSTFLEYTRSNNEFFAKFFVNKEKAKGGWSIKPHGFKYFYKELSNWSVYLRNPEHYGFCNNIKNLPEPKFIIDNIEWTEEQKKYLNNNYFNNNDNNNVDLFTKKTFYLQLSKGFIKNKNGKFETINSNKYNHILDIIKNNPNKQIMIWAMFNEEEKRLIRFLKENNISVNNITGSTHEEIRSEIVKDFKEKKFQVLISKPKLLGFGINLPFVNVQIFSGLNDSYEQFYQAVRRSYRYGATEQLKIYIPITSIEKKVYNNIINKKDMFEFDSLNQEKHFIKFLDDELKRFNGEKIKDKKMVNEIKNIKADGEDWKLYLSDSIIKLRNMEKESIDFSIFSPPFANLFAFSEKLGDMGNSRDNNEHEFSLHMEFFLNGLYSVMKTGRNVCCHVQQLSTYKCLDGFIGTKDFRGLIVELFKKAGFIFFGEFVIGKNPQAQAIRNKVRSLTFAQLNRDRLGSHPGFNDYILIFKKSGDTKIRINDETGPTTNEWINWASGIWTDIRETDTLNTKPAKSDDDVKHISPLQLEVIRRCIRLYTNKGDTVFDPFNGIGSSGVVSLELARKYIGIELKKEYFDESVKNLSKINLLDIDKIRKENIKHKLKSMKITNGFFK